MANEPVIFIGGGVGPMAGVALHAKIIEQTVTDGTDQSHFSVHHYSCSPIIRDRTEYLELLETGEKTPDAADHPGYVMAQVFERASRALDGVRAVAGVPCNTFHAPGIYDVFARTVREGNLPVQLVHMLDETVALIGNVLGKQPGSGGGGEKIGILCTLGTRKSGVYDRLLSAAGYHAFYLPMDEHMLVHEAIYDRGWGIKAISPVTPKAASVVAKMTEKLSAQGAAAVVLGCTELPLALPGVSHKGIPLVDPVLALARALIREANPAKLKPLA